MKYDASLRLSIFSNRPTFSVSHSLDTNSCLAAMSTAVVYGLGKFGLQRGIIIGLIYKVHVANVTFLHWNNHLSLACSSTYTLMIYI